jgi:hypothetical protein
MKTEATRVVLTDGTGRWFDAAKLESWRSWAGADGETLYRTPLETYVLRNHGPDWADGAWEQTYATIPAPGAASWLSRNGYALADAERAGAEVATAYAALEVM